MSLVKVLGLNSSFAASHGFALHTNHVDSAAMDIHCTQNWLASDFVNVFCADVLFVSQSSRNLEGDPNCCSEVLEEDCPFFIACLLCVSL